MRYILVKKYHREGYTLENHWDKFNHLMGYLNGIPSFTFTSLYGTTYQDRREKVKMELEIRGTLRSSTEHEIIIDLKSKKLDKHYLKIISKFKSVIRDIRLDDLLDKENEI
ncbi:MAG: hypothetical protein SLAVMIC_00735 [uncultured marine phage]|uniref:Uncharacterized protein n=1 Tax=uncultured marine phage TaxID=707152 RepID=A0A8D9FSD7_9VIRU|nr:MAG: hypothetical protein SLAVMIC_00735 [uncultured marine phage]